MSADSKPPFAGEARRVRLGELISKAKIERCGDRLFPVLSMTMHDGIIKQSERFKKSIASKDVSTYKVVCPGQLVVGFPIDEGVIYIQGFDEPGIMSPAYNVWDIDTSVVAPSYLELALHGPACMAYYADKMRGTTARRRTLTSESLTAMSIPLPSLDQQKRIVGNLCAVRSQLAICHRQLSLLDDLVKSRFVEMFGDPFENPMGFSCQNLSSLGELKNGMNFHKGESGVDIRCLGVADFGDRSELRDASELGTASLSTFPPEGAFLRDGDVVFVRSNGNKKLVGRCMAVYPGEEKTIFSGFCIRLRVTSEDVRVPYLVWALKQSSIRDAIVGRGANIKNLSQDTLGKVRLPIPPLNVQDTFLDFAACVAKSQLVVQKQIERLQTLYDSLAQNYFG